MKILLTAAILLATQLTFGAGVPTSYATVSGTVTTVAWTPVVSGIVKAASTVMISNTGTSFLIVGVGASGTEVSTGLIIPPSAAPILVPLPVTKNSRLSVKALNANSTGVLGMVFFQ